MRLGIIIVKKAGGEAFEAATPPVDYAEARRKYRDMRGSNKFEVVELWSSTGGRERRWTVSTGAGINPDAALTVAEQRERGIIPAAKPFGPEPERPTPNTESAGGSPVQTAGARPGPEGMVQAALAAQAGANASGPGAVAEPEGDAQEAGKPDSDKDSKPAGKPGKK